MKKLIISVVIVIGITIALLIGCGGEDSVDSFAAPLKPSPASGGVVATRFPILNWEDVPGAVRYELQVCEQSDFVDNIIEVIINPASIPASEYPCEDELNQTTYYWRVRAQNSGGAWTEWSETWSFTVDLGVMVPGNPDPVPDEFIYDTELLFDWEDIVSASEYEIKVSEESDFSSYIVGPDETVTESEYQIPSPLEFKTYYWRVRVRNDGGTWEEWSDMWSFTVYLIMQPSPNEAIIVDETPLLDWEEYWEDQTVGDAQYEVAISDTEDFLTPVESSGTIDDDEYQVGTTLGYHVPYYWRVRVRLDAGASWSNWSRTFGFIVTNLPPPSVTGDTPTNDNTPTWSWTQPSPSTVEYRHRFTDGSGWTETLDTQYTPAIPLDDGDHTLYVQGGDGLGNWSLTSGSFTIIVDTIEPSAPTITSSSHPTETDWYSNNTPNFSMSADGTGSGIQGYSYEMDQSISTIPDENRDTTGSSYGSPTRSDGIWYFHVRAEDNAGNWGLTSHYRVYIDVTSPSAIVISSSTHPDDTAWYDDDSPEFGWTESSDATSDIWGYSTMINQSPTTIPNETANIFELSWDPGPRPEDGTWYCHVRAVDNAGNGGPTDHYTVNIDTTAPTVTVSSLLTNDQTPQLTGTVNETSASIGVTVDGATYGATNNGDGTWTLADDIISTLAEGTYDVLAEATDAAGNTGSDSTGGELVIDITPPSFPPTVTGTSPTNDTTPTWDWDDVGSVYRCGWAEGDWFPDTVDVSEFTPGSPLGSGEHTLYVQAGDDALPEPNWSTTSEPFTIMIYIWTDLGSASTGLADWISIAIDPSDNKPVVVIRDAGNAYGAHVLKWDTGTTWTDLGYASTGGANAPSIAIDPSDNKPVVVFGDDTSGRMAQVLKWDDGTTWTDLGYASTVSAWWTSIAIDPSDNKPVVVFRDATSPEPNLGRAQVLKWDDGTTWTDLGYASTGDSYNPSIVIDPSDNKPVVVFQDSGRTHVTKWDTGTTWTDLGYASVASSDYASIAIDPSDNKPIVVFMDRPNHNFRAHVMKWDTGTTWTDLGYASTGRADYTSIAIDTSDPSDPKPVVVFSDADSVPTGRAHVMKWDTNISGTASGGSGTTMTDSSASWSPGEWVGYGVCNTSDQDSWAIITSNSANQLTFSGGLSGVGANVFLSGDSYRIDVYTDLGYVSTGGADNTSIAIGSDNSPVVVFSDGDNSDRAHVMRVSY